MDGACAALDTRPMPFDLPPAPHHFTPEHEAFRASVRLFVQREIAPHAAAWDEAGTFPRALYAKAAAIGLMGIGYPEEYGGTPADPMYSIIAAEELALAGSGGVQASLGSLHIGLPPVAALGRAELKARVLPPVLRGEQIAALAITEPGGGSDVAALRTTAVRDGDHYVVNGEKTFITSGMRADWITVAVRTDPASRGANGISLLLVPGDTPGLERTLLAKTGWWASDTAHLRFTDCRVPAGHLLGEEHQGFYAVMKNFQTERIALAAMAIGHCTQAIRLTLEHVRTRRAFGAPLWDKQVIRQRLAMCDARTRAAREYAYHCAWRVTQGHDVVQDVSLLKALTGELVNEVTATCQQFHGGMGFMTGTPVERLWRDARVLGIGGGATEVMLDEAAKRY